MIKWLVVMLGAMILLAQLSGAQVAENDVCSLRDMPALSALLPSNMQAELAPYLAASSEWSKDAGIPLIHPPCMDFPRDENAPSIKDQYMVGPGLMVAPIASGASRDVYLPLARWYNFWTGKVIGGGRSVQFETTEGPVPIYVKGSSVIPTAEAGSDNIVFRVYAGYAPASCTLCPTGGEGCSLRAYRVPNGTEIVINPGRNCPQRSATFVINLPYRDVASVSLDGQALQQLPSDQLSSAAQGWNQEGTIVRVKIPITKQTLIHIAYKLWAS